MIGGIDFGSANTSRYYSIADNSALTLPDSNWCIGVRVKLASITGSAFRYLISTGNFAATNSFNLLFTESSAGGVEQTMWKASIYGASTSVDLYGNIESASDPEKLIIIQRNGSNFQLKACELGGTIETWATAAIGTVGAINGGTWIFGGRTDLSSTRFYKDHAGHFFLLDTALSDAQIEQLANGDDLTDASVSGSNILFEFQPTGPDATLTDLSGNSRTATRNGSSWPSASTYELLPDAALSAPSTAPGNFTATAVSKTQINLAWDAVSGADGYKYRVDGGTPVDTSTTQSASVTGLTVDTAYDFEVLAYNAGGDGPWSSVVAESTNPRQATVTLTTDGSTPITGETGIVWALYESNTAAPVVYGTTETSDGSGVVVIDLPGASGSAAKLVTTLADGRVGVSVVSPA